MDLGSSLTVIGWFVQVLLDQGSTFAIDRWRGAGAGPDLPAALERLRGTINNVRALLPITQKIRSENEGLLESVKDLKDAAYDAEDILSELDYYRLQEEVEGNDNSNNSSIGSSMIKAAASRQETVDSQSEDKSKDNRALIDNNTAQSLSSEDIEAMRREGVTGDEIIEALIANSSTFGKKTTFSQEKYKLKKQKKYAPKILLRRPFSRSICEGYFKKYPTRIGFLRVDALSLLLSMANVSAYSDVLVVDMVGGILTGAVAERIGGTGYVCNTYFGAKSHSLDIVRIFNFSSEVCSRVVQAPYSDLCFTHNRENEGSKLHEGLQSGSDIQNTSLLIEPVPSSDSILVMEKEASQEAELSTHRQSDSLMDASDCANGVEGSFSVRPCVTDAMHVSKVSALCKSVTPGRQASPEAITSWKKNGFSSLIVAAPEMEVGNILQKLLPLLSYSSPFAVYHQYLQPLSTCMQKLQASRLAIGLQISEPWLREYQVLPCRTHPHMQMSGSGGYILSGIRICNNQGN